MKKRFNKLASVLICITFAVFLLFIKDQFGVIWEVICNVASVLTPVLYGFAIAYILNFPYRFLRNKVFGKIKSKSFQKFNKPLSLVLTYVIVLGLVTFMVANMIPQLYQSITGLVTDFPSMLSTFKDNTSDFVNWLSNYGINISEIESVNTYIGDQLSQVLSVDNLNKISNLLIPAVTNTAMFFYNWIIGIILSVYMLASKEFLTKQLKRFCTAFLPTKWMPTIYEIISVTDNKCGKFLVGKILDSTIIGVLSFICMTILGIPYALLISVIVGVCNIIPFFGPFISAIPCGLLLLMISPIDCLKFVIMVFILQQIDGNFIGPKIVGSQVGLAGFWSLFSVIIAGGLFGVEGMILGTPIFAAIYTLLGKVVRRRVNMKGDNAKRVLEMPVIQPNGITNIKAKKQKKSKNKEEDSDSSDSQADQTDKKE